MKIELVLFFCFVLTAEFKAQQRESALGEEDSLKSRFSIDSAYIFRNKPITLYATIDFRNAFVEDRFLSFIGPMAGVTLENKHIVGFAYYFLNKFSPFQSDKVKVYSFEKINYLTFFYQYILYDTKRLELLIPFEIGYGNYKAQLENEGENEFVESTIIPFGIGMRCVLFPHKWIGFKLGAGYRYVYEQSQHVGMDGVYFALGIKLDIRTFYMDYSYHRLKHKYNRTN